VKEVNKTENKINWYVITLIFILIVAYDIANSIEPSIEEEFDFFEITRMLGFLAVSLFSFVVAKRYWGSTVFGKAYLALAIGYAFYFFGDLLWYVFEIGYQVENPYPYYPDIGYFGFFPFAIYHLKTNVHYFKRKLDTSQKKILFLIPFGTALIFTIGNLVPFDASSGLTSLKILPVPVYEQTYYIEFLTGLAFVIATTVTFVYAIIGAQVFQTGQLSTAWRLILVGIGLNTFADVHYYFAEMFGDFDRTNPVHGIWVASTMILCYALYKHMKSI